MDREALLGREDEAWERLRRKPFSVPEDRRDAGRGRPADGRSRIWCGTAGTGPTTSVTCWSGSRPGSRAARPGLGRAQPDGGSTDGKAKSWDEVVVAPSRADRARQALIAMTEVAGRGRLEFT